MDKIELFLKELRDSSDRMYDIFTTGSCFRLYLILKHIYSKAEPYWSDIDSHAISKINNNFYDIGGKLDKEYVKHKQYVKVDKNFIKGYSLLKKTEDTVDLKVIVEKYK